MIMVQKHQLANTGPPSLSAILNKFLNFNNTVHWHFGQNIDSWPHEILSEFSEALENNPELCFETKERESTPIHTVLLGKLMPLLKMHPITHQNMLFLKPA